MNAFTSYAGAVMFSLGLVFSAGARDKVIEKKEGEPTTEKEFVAHALANQVTEIKLAELALIKTRNDDVRKYANRLIEDHKKVREQLIQRARDIKLAVGEGLEADKREKMDKLSKLEGNEFNREYLDFMVQAHEKAIRAWEKWSKEARDDQVRELAKKTLPTLKAHLERAKELRDKVKS